VKPPPPASKLLLGTLLPILAVVGIVLAITGFRHSDTKAAGPAVSTAQVTTGPVDPRQAFDDCMRNAGVSRGSRVGRFGSRPNLQKFRQAFEICRSITQNGAAPSVPIAPTTTAAPPIA
jgi:hypothetical protein